MTGERITWWGNPVDVGCGKPSDFAEVTVYRSDEGVWARHHCEHCAGKVTRVWPSDKPVVKAASPLAEPGVPVGFGWLSGWMPRTGPIKLNGVVVEAQAGDWISTGRDDQGWYIDVNGARHYAPAEGEAG